MKVKYTALIISIFLLSGCAMYFASDQEAYQVGVEENKTINCLNYSHINDLHNLYGKPNIGILGQMKQIVYETIGQTVFGAGRFNAIKSDIVFHNSMERKSSITAQGRNQKLNLSMNDCKPYLDHYERAYYGLKR
ncbi:hypothetical protein [Rodentibacter ratti]|uniref:Uncharacterized protein n=1 Tax=Rodentibacter ratti TaxID=1906745 RepID=A0A1V3L9D3_9PAST|nr:hypothetical protein [Rodentibacter ratti]OOF86220.1 hypothetical protein BKG88_05115 [Rodentibacter ratti]